MQGFFIRVFLFSLQIGRVILLLHNVLLSIVIKACISSNGALYGYKCKKGVCVRLIAHFLGKGLNNHNSYQTKCS
jgi:hypothetical protein